MSLPINDTPLSVVSNRAMYYDAVSKFAGPRDFSIMPAIQGILFEINGCTANYYFGILADGQNVIGQMHKGEFSWYSGTISEAFGR